MKHLRSLPLWIGTGLLIIDGLFFGLTNPKEIASIMLIVGFALVLLNLYVVLHYLQKLSSFYFPWLANQKKLTLGLMICAGLLLALQSIGQLSSRDAVLIPLATLVIYAYSSYGKHRSTANNN